MLVYIYQSALLCEECGDKVRAELCKAGKAPADPDDEASYDSDDYPKGPFPDGGGEADTPQHCDACHAFLENPLTTDGEKYVRDAIERALVEGKTDEDGKCVALSEWRGHYGIDAEDARAIVLARCSPELRKALSDDEKRKGKLDAYAWPGGYPLFYMTNGGDACCTKCANDASTGLEVFGVWPRDRLVAREVNWEDADLYCDCGDRIESAYAEDESKKSE